MGAASVQGAPAEMLCYDTRHSPGLGGPTGVDMRGGRVRTLDGLVLNHLS